MIVESRCNRSHHQPCAQHCYGRPDDDSRPRSGDERGERDECHDCNNVAEQVNAVQPDPKTSMRTDGREVSSRKEVPDLGRQQCRADPQHRCAAARRKPPVTLASKSFIGSSSSDSAPPDQRSRNFPANVSPFCASKMSTLRTAREPLAPATAAIACYMACAGCLRVGSCSI